MGCQYSNNVLLFSDVKRMRLQVKVALKGNQFFCC